MKTYRVVHFTPQLAAGVFSTKGEPVDLQVANAIKKEAAEGWEFVSYQTVHVLVSPGCLAALFGKKSDIVYYDVLILSR